MAWLGGVIQRCVSLHAGSAAGRTLPAKRSYGTTDKQLQEQSYEQKIRTKYYNVTLRPAHETIVAVDKQY